MQEGVELLDLALNAEINSLVTKVNKKTENSVSILFSTSLVRPILPSNDGLVDDVDDLAALASLGCG